MNAEFKKIVASLQSGNPAPLYLVDGEEPYYLDLLTAVAEKDVLPAADKDFNLTVFYGKDAESVDIINACRRFPMFAARQLVILKDAAQMKTLGNLSAYFEHPSETTTLFVEHRSKKVDGRSKLPKLAKDKGLCYTSDKIKDEKLPAWIQGYGTQTGFKIGLVEAELLASFLGNDLQKIVNEIEKVKINVPDEQVLTLQLIQKYIGITRDYNLFEFPGVLLSRNKDKFYKMLSYFIANPKAAPPPLVVTVFYTQLERLLGGHYFKGKSENEIAEALDLKSAWTAKNYRNTGGYTLPQIEACMLLLADYSAKGMGVDSNLKDSQWLRELVGKMELILG